MNVLLTGSDLSRMEFETEKIRQKEKPDSVIRINAAKDSPASFYEMLDMFSLFQEKEMIIVENATFWMAKNTTDFQPDEIIKRQAEEKIIVYQVPGKLDSRKKSVKEMMARSKVIQCDPLNDKDLEKAIRQLLAQYQTGLDPDAYEWYLQHAGKDLIKIEKEVEKFSILSDHLSLEEVKALTTVEPVDNVFKMTDALFARQGMRFLAYYRNFRQKGMEPLAINGLLASQVRFVYQVKVMMSLNKSQQDMAKELQVSSGRVYNTMKNASRFSMDELLHHLESLAVLDEKLKSNGLSKDDAYEEFILKMILEEKGIQLKA